LQSPFKKFISGLKIVLFHRAALLNLKLRLARRMPKLERFHGRQKQAIQSSASD
jgi:hypothetical protein